MDCGYCNSLVQGAGHVGWIVVTAMVQGVGHVGWSRPREDWLLQWLLF